VALPKFGVGIPRLAAEHQGPSEAWTWCLAKGYILPSALRTVPLHPTQLYEALGDLLLAVLVLRVLRSLRDGRGPWSRVCWLHLGGYSILRFGLEFLHGDRDVTVWAGMTALQLGLALFALLAVTLYLKAPSTPGYARP
jgi:phosphatidylglycerol:prolipoprotein diacylglycerol transferase